MRCAVELHWSLYDIDRTDIVSLLRFAFRLWGGEQNGAGASARGLTPVDQAAGWMD